MRAMNEKLDIKELLDEIERVQKRQQMSRPASLPEGAA